MSDATLLFGGVNGLPNSNHCTVIKHETDKHIILCPYVLEKFPLITYVLPPNSKNLGLRANWPNLKNSTSLMGCFKIEYKFTI